MTSGLNSHCQLNSTSTNISLSSIPTPPLDITLNSCPSLDVTERVKNVLQIVDIPEHPEFSVLGWTFDSGAVSGKYHLVLPDINVAFTAFIGLSISIFIGVIFSSLIYHLLLDGKKLSLRKSVIGTVILLSSALLPYLLFYITETHNTAVRFIICISFVLYGFRTLEAIFGFVPEGAKSTLGIYIKYFSLPVEMLFDKVTNKPILVTKKDIFESSKNAVFSLCCIMMLCSILSPYGYRPFGHTNAGEFNEVINLGDYLLDTRHLGNCFAIAIFFQQALALGDAVLGNTVQVITGYKVLLSMKNPMLEATSPSDFWGRRWNVLIHSVMKRGVYKPVRQHSSALLASLAVFVMSGLFHEWLVHAVLIYNRPTMREIEAPGHVLIGSNTAFFIWNFVVIACERVLAGTKGVRSLGMVMPRLLITFTIIMTSLPFAHWFGNPYVNGQFFVDYEKIIPMIKKI